MTSVEWEAWQSDFEEAQKEEISLSGEIAAGHNLNKLSSRIRAFQKKVSKLVSKFKKLEPQTSAFTITEEELSRRKLRLDQLKKDQSTIQSAFNNHRGATSSSSSKKASATKKDLLGLQNQIIKDQDEQLDGIERGVSNLHQYSVAMRDESDLHVKLLDEIDADVQNANIGLENEAIRAAKVASMSGNFKLYLIILVLAVTLLMLLILGSG